MLILFRILKGKILLFKIKENNIHLSNVLGLLRYRIINKLRKNLLII